MNKEIFNFKDLEYFFERYPIESFIPIKLCRYPPFSIIDAKKFLKAFKYEQETGIDVMAEYLCIIKRMHNISYNRDFIYNRHYSTDTYEELDNDIEDINYILNYKGFWDINEFMVCYGLTREILLEDLNELLNDFPTSKNIKKNESRKKKDEYIEKYYNAKRMLSNEEAEGIFRSTLSLDKLLDNRINKDIINLTNIKYPIILFLFKKDAIVSISKIDQTLEQKMAYHRKVKDFNMYSYVYVNETFINDIYMEAMIRYNPIYFNNNSILDMSNSIYRSLSQVKQRYKGVKDINLRIIKKVIDIYQIPTYKLNNGHTFVDKDLFDEAIEKYYGGKIEWL